MSARGMPPPSARGRESPILIEPGWQDDGAMMMIPEGVVSNFNGRHSPHQEFDVGHNWNSYGTTQHDGTCGELGMGF